MPVKPYLLGCIADDLTGATDLSLMLTRRGMNVVQILGQPTGAPAQADALVIALKTRTAPAREAVSQSLAAARWLIRHGAKQIFFKYCSTFDSTDAGNIGPVAEALLEMLGAHFTVVCPAFPENSRTVYQGHLYICERLLSESSMRDHPLTPMTDAHLVRVLGRQVRNPSSVGLVPLEVVEQGSEAIRTRFDQLRGAGARFAVTDAVFDRHLISIGQACDNLALITGGSGIAMGLPENFRRAGKLPEKQKRTTLPRLDGPIAILSGSCSSATQDQVQAASQHLPHIELDPIALLEGSSASSELLQHARDKAAHGAVLIFSTAPPERVQEIQRRGGKERVSEAIEKAFAELAQGLVDFGVTKLIVAGGETSGAVAAALGIRRLEIGPEIAPGVPWMIRLDEPKLLLAFKSGNFGSKRFFLRALEMLP